MNTKDSARKNREIRSSFVKLPFSNQISLFSDDISSLVEA